MQVVTGGEAVAVAETLAVVEAASAFAIVTVGVVSSETWRAIIDAAEARGADAIVVGSHGYRAIDRIIGTNAARVADRARCLVIVVHEAPQARPSHRASDGPYRTKS